MLSETLADISVPGTEAYLMATLARGIRYRARADAANVSYQSHPLRRDFLLTFELTRGGAGDSLIFDVIQVVCGIQTSLVTAGGESMRSRLQILELELPLLGGRLWDASETGRYSDESWIELVADRIVDYRARARELRDAIEQCVTAEDYLRLSRDIAAVKKRLLERLGLRAVDLSPVERELVEGVASVSHSIPGVPNVTGLWMGVREVEKRYVFAGKPFQRFLYKEFVKAWKRSGRLGGVEPNRPSTAARCRSDAVLKSRPLLDGRFRGNSPRRPDQDVSIIPWPSASHTRPDTVLTMTGPRTYVGFRLCPPSSSCA